MGLRACLSGKMIKFTRNLLHLSFFCCGILHDTAYQLLHLFILTVKIMLATNGDVMLSVSSGARSRYREC